MQSSPLEETNGNTVISLSAGNKAVHYLYRCLTNNNKHNYNQFTFIITMCHQYNTIPMRKCSSPKKSFVSPSQVFSICHLGPDNFLLGEAVLCHLGSLAASLASGHLISVALSSSPAITTRSVSRNAKCPER